MPCGPVPRNELESGCGLGWGRGVQAKAEEVHSRCTLRVRSTTVYRGCKPKRAVSTPGVDSLSSLICFPPVFCVWAVAELGRNNEFAFPGVNFSKVEKLFGGK